MTTTQKRLPGSVIVQQSAIEQATNLLEQLPEKPKEIWSLREAIDLLQDSINAALSRGYSHEDVATMLVDKGIKISVSSLKRYLASTKKDKTMAAVTKPRRPRRTSAQKQAEAEAEASSVVTPSVSVLPQAMEESAASTPTKRSTRRSTSTRTKTVAKDTSPVTAKTTSTKTTSSRARKNKA